MVGFGIVSCSGPEPTPAPYWLPRHPEMDATPLGLAEGVLEARGKCLYLNRGLLIWPHDFYITERDGRPVVVGGGWLIAPGDHIEVGGGSYNELSDLPSGAAEAASVPCSGPYIWVSRVRDVSKAD